MGPEVAAAQFDLPIKNIQISAYGKGNINDTFLVVGEGGASKYILQRINGRVFPAPELVMKNLQTVTHHMGQRLKRDHANLGWRVAEIIPSRDGMGYWVDENQDYWRMVGFIDRTITLDKVDSVTQARQVGEGLALFHGLLSDLDAGALHDTLPGFHVTPKYLAEYDRIAAAARDREELFCSRFVEARRNIVGILEEARRSGLLTDRVMHGDPKVNNFLFDQDTLRAVSLVDLDTVKPGLIHYDIGDCLRSCCNPVGEEVADSGQVYFDIGLCRAVLTGYLANGATFLTDADYGFIYDSIRLIAFELGLRFYADFLSGNRYFKVNDPAQNLRRAMVQFWLTERIEALEDEIRAMVKELRKEVAP